MSDSKSVRTRFAPSPSGHLHVGGARTALFCWAYARGRDGTFIIRIEDTDRKRSSDAASMAFLEDLKWLGLAWDEGPEFEGCGGGDHGPYYQSERREIYDRYLRKLLVEGKAYRAFETPEEIEAARELARKEKRTYVYDRAALRLDPATVERHVAEGRPHVVRFKVPDGREVVVHDSALGIVRVNTDEIGDFVIRKADGFPTYHFAVVVDDELMGITHVIRGQEHLVNTPRHVLLQEALGFRTPVYAHGSVILNVDGTKMSKRDKDKALRKAVRERGLAAAAAVDAETFDWWLSDKHHQLDLDRAEALAQELGIHLPEINIEDFRRAGYLPEVLLNYIALLGWSPGGDVEKFAASYLLEQFDFERMVKSPSRFDRDKLLAFNLDALQAMPPEEFAQRFRDHCVRYHPAFVDKLDEAQLDLLARANQKRSKTLDDPIESSRFFVMDDDEIVVEDSKNVRKALLKGAPNGYAHLEAVQGRLAGLGEWTVDALEACVHAYAGEHASGKLGAVAQPLRVAVSGGTVSPPIFETLAILGREATLRRIDRCLTNRLPESEA